MARAAEPEGILMTVLGVHQPAYLPWLGYFDKLSRSDLFIYLDSVQFEAGSFINRNKIKTANGPIWLTIPVFRKGHCDSTMKETRIDNRQPWATKHLRSIEFAYKNAPRFSVLFPKLEGHYREAARYDLLADFCYADLQLWLGELNITTNVVRSSSLALTTQKSDLVLEICRHFGATRYISGALGRNYLSLESFSEAGIEIEFQDYRHPIYPQQHGAFQPFMGIVDLLMNTTNTNVITGAAP